MKKRIRSIVNRIRMVVKRTADRLNRTAERIDRNRPIIRGVYLKPWDARLHPRHNRPKLYIQRYGKRN